MDIGRYNGIFANELCNLGLDVSISGFMGFGVGGTNARVELWGRTRNRFLATERRLVLSERIDVFCVPCPRCACQMCHRCLMAVPTVTVGKHKCVTIRDLGDTHNVCSNCYTG